MKINDTNISIKLVKGYIGSFDYGFEFCDSEREVIEEIIEWLSNCCSENFIVSESIHRLVAGGYSDNKQAFKNGHFDLLNGERGIEGSLGTYYEIRLQKDDFMAFRLRWLDESTDDEIDE